MSETEKTGLEGLFQKYKRIVFFDTETTGFDSDKDDQIIELAAVAVDRDGAEQRMDKFIQLTTKDELPAKVTEVTGILPITLSAEGKPEPDVIREFIRMMELPEDADLFDQLEAKTLLVAHNAQFDLLFLAYTILRNKEVGKGWMTVFNDADYLDSLTIYKDRRDYPHKLENAITAYGLDGKVQNSHRAIDDTLALYEVVKAMGREEDNLINYVNVFGYNPKYGITGRTFKKVRYLSQPYRYGGRGEPLYTKTDKNG